MPISSPIRVMVVDDDPMVRRLLVQIINLSPERDSEVVAQAGTAREALETLTAVKIDVVLMDVAMPGGMDGIEATRQLRTFPHPPHVIVVTTLDADDEAVRAAEAGASGFILKSEDLQVLLQAIRNVAAGDGALSPRAAKQVYEYLAATRTVSARRRAQEKIARLTARELEVARQVSRGLSNRDIGEKLHLSESTVKTHLSAIVAKMGVEGRIGVAVDMTRAGLLDDEPV
ncbi:response regulator [Actinotignum sp. GS-2025b]|uniref:response regulator n=1 Tax=Actinotignum sp. GS-2025b TaxID=3427275 RepID=UPI003F46D5E9